jgi:hypothetical protein
LKIGGKGGDAAASRERVANECHVAGGCQAPASQAESGTERGRVFIICFLWCLARLEMRANCEGLGPRSGRRKRRVGVGVSLAEKHRKHSQELAEPGVGYNSRDYRYAPRRTDAGLIFATAACDPGRPNVDAVSVNSPRREAVGHTPS